MEIAIAAEREQVGVAAVVKGGIPISPARVIERTETLAKPTASSTSATTKSLCAKVHHVAGANRANARTNVDEEMTVVIDVGHHASERLVG